MSRQQVVLGIVKLIEGYADQFGEDVVLAAITQYVMGREFMYLDAAETLDSEGRVLDAKRAQEFGELYGAISEPAGEVIKPFMALLDRPVPRLRLVKRNPVG